MNLNLNIQNKEQNVVITKIQKKKPPFLQNRRILQLNATEIIANLREKLLLVGHEAEMLLDFSFSEADDVARNVLIFFTF